MQRALVVRLVREVWAELDGARFGPFSNLEVQDVFVGEVLHLRLVPASSLPGKPSLYAP